MSFHLKNSNKKNQDTTVALAKVKNQIAREMFNLSKVVDDGKFHIVLEKGIQREMELNFGIPVCCKLILEKLTPPLDIKVSSTMGTNLSIFASFTAAEPTAENNDRAWVPLKRQKITFNGVTNPKKPHMKIFESNTLYLTFISQQEKDSLI